MNTTEKIKIGNIELSGRIVMPPVATYQCDDDGKVNDKVCDYYYQRAKNPNVSMIITEHNFVNEAGKARAKQMSIASDDCIDGLKKLTDAIHNGGAFCFSQLNHAGSAATTENGNVPVAPSEIINLSAKFDTVPKALTKEDIENLKQDYVNAAKRAVKAGYDGVEIHSAHGYLLNQFYSPLTNKREDEYGGCLENRLRLLVEIIRAVREAVGNDYPISVRLGGCDYMDGGSTIEDAVNACKILSKENIQLLNISGGMCRYTVKGRTEAGYFGDMTKAIKEVTNIPVMLTGGVKTLEQASELIENGTADIIGVGRPLLTNPNWEM